MSEPRVWTMNIGSHQVIVDYNMIPILKQFTWHIGKNKNTFYAYTNVKIAKKFKRVSMHRLLTGLVSTEIDHKNRNGLDNRLENLRFCTKSQNQCNKIRKNKYGYRGVFKPSKCNTFAFQVQGNGKRIARYGFKTAKEAALAYDKVVMEVQGEFGIRNFES